MSYYAVGLGRVPGVYSSWDDCQAQVKGLSCAAFEKFDDSGEAVDYVAHFWAGDVFVSTRGKRKASSSGGGDDVFAIQKRARLGELEIYTDGNCRDNGRPCARAGSGIYFVRNGKAEARYSSVPGAQTNNRAEIYAMLLALDATLDVDAICIKPDSEYVAKSLTDPTWLALAQERLEEARLKGVGGQRRPLGARCALARETPPRWTPRAARRVGESARRRRRQQRGRQKMKRGDTTFYKSFMFY